MKLPQTLALMHERRLKVTNCTLSDNKVTIVWGEQPSEYEREIAQSCTHYQICIHQWS